MGSRERQPRLTASRGAPGDRPSSRPSGQGYGGGSPPPEGTSSASLPVFPGLLHGTGGGLQMGSLGIPHPACSPTRPAGPSPPFSSHPPPKFSEAPLALPSTRSGPYWVPLDPGRTPPAEEELWGRSSQHQNRERVPREGPFRRWGGEKLDRGGPLSCPPVWGRAACPGLASPSWQGRRQRRKRRLPRSREPGSRAPRLIILPSLSCKLRAN